MAEKDHYKLSIQKSTAQEHSNFLFQAYCGLLLRGFDRERDIPDPILRKVWRLGKKIKEYRVPRRRTSKPKVNDQ